MKANIYGFDVEGSPEELIMFKKLIETQPKQTSVYIKQPSVGDNPLKWNEITCNAQIWQTGKDGCGSGLDA